MPECVAAEVRVTGPDGLVSTPFLHRMSTAPVVAPDHERTPIARLGEGAAADGPVAARFATPMLGFGEEDVPAGRRLRRFAERRHEGKTVHTGTDVGALLEGAGVYAFADGLVRFIHTGGDMGTLLVVEHRVGERELECVVLMHLAGVVFVRAGERVTAGQLLGSLGTGFSFENGGHYPHLHVGIYPGAFSPSHNYGYRAAADGLADWLDPEFEIADRIDRTRPPIDDFGPVAPVLAPVAALAREGEYRAALAALHDVIAHTKFEEASHGDAVRILEELEQAAIHVAERAQLRRFHGFPTSARALLTKDAATLEGLPNARVPSSIAREWAASPDFAAELAAEARFEAAVHEETRLLAAGDVAGARDLWSAFPRDAGAVSLRGRIQRRIDALPSAAR